MKDDSDGDKKQQIHHIQNLYAFNLFCQKRFDDSMQVFAKLGTGESPDTRHSESIQPIGASVLPRQPEALLESFFPRLPDAT